LGCEHEETGDAMIETTVIEARVIPWEMVPGEEATGIWGIAVRYANGVRQAYQVGNRLEAERELAKINARKEPSGHGA
jgi:hypothetical protein